jgi:hypothetical protein
LDWARSRFIPGASKNVSAATGKKPLGRFLQWMRLPESALRGAEAQNPGAARDRSEIQPPMSPGDHSLQDAILSHHMMIKRVTGARRCALLSRRRDTGIKRSLR